MGEIGRSVLIPFHLERDVILFVLFHCFLLITNKPSVFFLKAFPISTEIFLFSYIISKYSRLYYGINRFSNILTLL